MIKAILAMDDNNGIAKNGKMPWHNKEDFEFFKETTTGNGKNILVMGRKTRETLPKDGLPNRVNITMTHSPIRVDQISSWDSITELHDMCEDLFIIGGESIYKHAFEESIPEEVYISRILGNYDCDQFIDLGMLYENYKQIEQTQFETFTLEVWNKR